MIRRILKTGLLASAAFCLADNARAQSAGVDDQAPSEIVVTGTKYRGEVASGGARIDAKIEDLPLSISVVTEALIDDRQVRNLRDLSENVAGVRSRASGSGAFTIDFTIRGLQGGNGSVTAVNGFRVDNFSAGFDPQSVERVEFLKGPAAVLYGASGALSGLVNIVTKTPQSDTFLNVDVTGGVPAYGRVGVDANLAISDTLDARVNAAITNEFVPTAFRDINAQFVAPSLRWHPISNFSILLEGSYFHATQPSRSVLNLPPDLRFTTLPRNLKLGEVWDKNENTGYTARGEVNWEIADGMTLRQGVNLQDYREDDFNVGLGSSGDLFLDPDTVTRFARRGNGEVRYVVSQSEIRWNVSFGGMKHTLLAGFEYGDQKFGGLCCTDADIAPLNLLNPVYGAPRPNLGLTELFSSTIKAKAGYIQDFIELGRFKLLAGLRYDDVKSTSGFCSSLTPGCVEGDPVVNNLGSANETAFSPRLGLVWQPTDRTTIFASFSKSFNPNTSLDRNNRLLPPERGTQYEIGLRQDLFDSGKLTLALAAFDLTRQNISSCDPDFPDCDRFVAIGEQRVKGVEAELSGKPTDWIDVIATYAYLDGKVTKSDPITTGIPIGSDLPEAARHSASLFTKIGLAPLGARDFAISAGVYYVGSRPGRDFFGAFSTGPFARPLTRLPGSTRLDLGAFWDVSTVFRLQANITNVFDVKVFEPVNLGFNFSQRRRATLGGTVKF